MLSYIKSLFNYCLLVWLFCYRGIIHKMNKIHEQCILLLLKNYKDDFQDLLRSSCDISIHERCINSLLTQVYMCIHRFPSKIFKEIFSAKVNIYNTRKLYVFETHIPTWNRYGLNSIKNGMLGVKNVGFLENLTCFVF